MKNFKLCFFLFMARSVFTSEGELPKEHNTKKPFTHIKILNMEYGQTHSRDFESKLFGESFESGNIGHQNKLALSLNVPVYKWKKLLFSNSTNYTFHKFDFNNVKNQALADDVDQNNDLSYQKFTTSLNATFFSSLFSKPFIYNGSVIIDGDNNGVERVKGLVGASVILKRTNRITITTGLMVFSDPTAQIPFFPTFSYNHKSYNSTYELDLFVPQHILIRRRISTFGRLSFGTTLGGTGFYTNVNQSDFGDVFEYSQLEVNTGFIFEQQLSNSLVATMKGGVVHFLSNRLTEKGEPNKDFIYENKQDMTGYFNVGLSFNPFVFFK